MGTPSQHGEIDRMEEPLTIHLGTFMQRLHYFSKLFTVATCIVLHSLACGETAQLQLQQSDPNTQKNKSYDDVK